MRSPNFAAVGLILGNSVIVTTPRGCPASFARFGLFVIPITFLPYTAIGTLFQNPFT